MPTVRGGPRLDKSVLLEGSETSFGRVVLQYVCTYIYIYIYI